MTDRVFRKDPDATLDYEFRWESWLAEGDSIASAAVVSDPGITVESASNLSGTVHTVWLSGGTAGRRYRVTSRVTTTQGRVDDDTITVLVEEG